MIKKNTIKKFIKKYSARITAAILVVGAIGVGVLENNISNAEAINIGTGGSSPIAKGSGGKGSCSVYPFVPGIAITPKIYDLTSAYQKNTAGNWTHSISSKNEKGEQDGKTIGADKNNKNGAASVTANLIKGEAKYDGKYNESPKDKEKFNALNHVDTYYKWLSHTDASTRKGGWFSYPKLGQKTATQKEMVENSIVKQNNFGRRISLTNLITLRPEKLSKSSIVYVSHASVNYHNHGNPYLAKWALRVYTDDDSDDGIKGGNDAQKQIVWMAQDGVSDFTDSGTAKKSSDQRKKNCNKLKKKIFGSYSCGIFDSLIHDQIDKMKADKDYKNKWYISFKGSDGREKKVVNQIALMDYLDKKGGLDTLLKEAQNSKRGSAARKVFGLAANIYQNGSYFACPETIEDYVSMTAYNCIKNKKVIQDDLDNITKYYGGSKNKAENEAYKSFLSGKDKAGNATLDMDEVYHVGSSNDDKYTSFTARYIDSEYNLAYLDMLLCGYATSYKNATKNDNKFNGSEKSKVVSGWKAAVKQFIKGANSNEDKFVTVRFDVCGIQQSKPKGYQINIASAGDIAHSAFLGKGAQYQEITEDSKSKNEKAIVKSFIGIQNDATSTNNNLQYNTNKQIKTYDKAKDLNTLYKRIGKAAYQSHNKKKKWKVFTQNNGLFTHALLQELFDLPSIFKASKNYKSLADNKPKMERVSFLKSGIGNSIKGISRSYSYGTYATVPLEFYAFDENNPTKKYHPTFEMRLYSVKAHGKKNLKDDGYPDQGSDAYAPDGPKERNGIYVHDTAETAKDINIGKPTDSSRKMTLHDSIYLKLDALNEDEEYENLLRSDACIRVTYYGKDPEDTSKITGYESLSKLAKTDPQSDTMKLKDTNDKQDKKQLACINDESKYSFKGVKITTDSTNSTNVRADNSHELYPPAKEAKRIKDNAEQIKTNSSYYGEGDNKYGKGDNKYGKDDNKWENTNDYMNLVWQTKLNEMTKDIDTDQDGIEITIPEKSKWKVTTDKEGTKKYTWEHYYRICIRAKIEILNKDGTYYYKDDSGKPNKENSLIWTNPVYVTYHVKGNNTEYPEKKFEFYGNNGSINNSESVKAHAYSEFKEGSVYNETFEAMAGVPSTRTMYFTTGGEEFMVNLQAVYDDYVAKKGTTVGKNGENVDPDAYRAVRRYTVHFNGVDCEYKEGDTFKALAAGGTSSEKFAADANDERQTGSAVRQKNNAIRPTGATSGNTDAHTDEHSADYTVTWEGDIANNTGDPGFDQEYEAGKPGVPCQGDGYTKGNGHLQKLNDPSTDWDVNKYNTALQNATDWAKKMEQIGKTHDGTTWRWDDSDGAIRYYHCGTAVVKITLSNGAATGSSQPIGGNMNPNFSSRNGNHGSDCYSAMKLESNEEDVLGAGYSYNQGTAATGGKSGCCEHGGKPHKEWDDPPRPAKGTPGKPGYEPAFPGVKHQYNHHDWFNVGTPSKSAKSNNIHYVITVSWKDGRITSEWKDGNGSNGQVSLGTKDGLSKIENHAMCGPCCEHRLPAIEDTWTQKLRYDTVRFSAMQVWKLDDGYAGDTGEVEDEEWSTIKTKTEGDGDYINGEMKDYDMSQAPGTTPWDGTTRLTGNEADYVRSKIVRYDPNIFYNVAQSETSRAGRIRYSLQTGQDDDVYYEEMGDPDRSGGRTRDNLCDGQTGSHSTSPVTVNASGHKKNFCKGCLYTNSSYSNDMYHHNNPKKSETDYKDWNGIKDPNKTTIGPVADTKTGYSDKKVDAIDKKTTEWKRFDARRAEPNEATVISDFLVLQTSSGDQSMFYFDNEGKTVKTKRSDENFPDDFWYSKPVNEKHIQKINNGWHWYVENVPKADDMWRNHMWSEQEGVGNPLCWAYHNETTYHVNIGSYNGRFKDATHQDTSNKFKGTGNNEKVLTAFDDDDDYFNGSASDDMLTLNADGFKSRDGRACQSAEIYNSASKSEHSRRAETKAQQAEEAKLCNSDNPDYVAGNLSSPGCGNGNYDTGTEGSTRANRNTYDFYKAPTMQSAWGPIRWSDRIPAPSSARFGNAGLVLLQDGISMNPTIMNREYITGQSYVFYKPIINYMNKEYADNSDSEKSCYETENTTGEIYNIEEEHEGVKDYEFDVENALDEHLNKTGVTYESKYSDYGGWTKVNDIIIHDPVSVQYSKVIGADPKYDQRIYGDDKSNAKTENEQSSEEKCPGTAADCVYRVLNCKYGDRIREAAFSVDNATITSYDEDDPSSGSYTTINSEVTSNGGNYASLDLTGSGFKVVHDDGRAFTVNDPESGDGDTFSYSPKHLEGSAGASLAINWDSIGVDSEKTSEAYEAGGDFTFSGTGKEALFTTEDTTVTRNADGKIEVTTSHGNYVSKETVGTGKHLILYRFALDSVLFEDVKMKIDGKTYTFKANTGVKVDGTDLTFERQYSIDYEGTPKVDNAGEGFTIGNAKGGSLDASYSLDNIRIDRLPGSTEHTAGCFTGMEIHATTTQNYYNGTGNLSKGKIDWTGVYDDLTMTQTGQNNTHKHTKDCLSSPSEGFKIAVNEASQGNTTDLKKELGTTVWNKVKDRLTECYGGDDATESVSVGSTKTYGYKGSTEKVTLYPGKYEIEAYGAKGGNDSQAGGNGGYAKGTYKVDKATDIYIAAGGKGADSATGNGGGYNGGGNAGRSGSSGGGGGATSVSLANGTLRQVMDSNRGNVLLVAGGGGGAGNQQVTDTSRSNSGTSSYGSVRQGAKIHEFTAQASGTLHFWSSSYTADPWATVYRNGSIVKQDDDHGDGLNFDISNLPINQGDHIELWVGAYRYGGECTWHYSYTGTRTVNGLGGTGGGISGGEAEGFDSNAFGGSSAHASYKGYGGDCRAADGAGGGGGYYGGYGAENDVGAGGGSGFVSPVLTGTTMSNGVNGGNGYVRIKVLELKMFSLNKVFSLVKSVIGENYDQIPDTVTTDGYTINNPIWVCKGKYDDHICNDQCKTNARGNVDYTLDCSEPHHTGEHYEVGNEMCYDACNDDAKHKAGNSRKVVKDRNGKPVSGNNEAEDSGFIRLDNYFTVYYPLIGDFYESNDNGILYTQRAKGKGYVDQMDCTEWTREKWICFPYNVLYKRQSNEGTGHEWEEHPAGEWFQVDMGYEDASGKFHPYDYYNFYCQLDNDEMNSATVQFFVESINDVDREESPCGYPNPYGRDDNRRTDCPEDGTWMTNAKRFDMLKAKFDAYHTAHKIYHIDVVGRIGNLLFEDTTDWRFSNFFKKAKKPLKWNKDGIAYEVDKTKQNMYYSWHLNNDDTSEDIRTQKVGPNIEWYNTYQTTKWTDVGYDYYKAAPTPLEAWKNYTHQDSYFNSEYGKGVSEALKQDHLNFGYDLLWDISTIGNYYDGNLQIEPKYFAFDTWTKKVIPVDVHVSRGDETKPINYFGLMDEYAGSKTGGSSSGRYDGLKSKLDDYEMNLDWKHEQAERNAVGKEWQQTLDVSEAFPDTVSDSNNYVVSQEDPDTGFIEDITVNRNVPHGEHYRLGNIQFQYLDPQRTSTNFGNSNVTALNSGTIDNTDVYTQTKNVGINGGIDQELWHNYDVLGNQLDENNVNQVDYNLRGQRWHTKLGLPENVRFTDATPADGSSLANHIDPDTLIKDDDGDTIYAWQKFDNDRIEQKTGKRRYLFLETATITAIGDVWDLRYDQKENNGHITVGDKYSDNTYTYYFQQTDKFPTLLAVYDGGITEDYDTLQTH